MGAVTVVLTDDEAALLLRLVSDERRSAEAAKNEFGIAERSKSFANARFRLASVTETVIRRAIEREEQTA